MSARAHSTRPRRGGTRAPVPAVVNVGGTRSGVRRPTRGTPSRCPRRSQHLRADVASLVQPRLQHLHRGAARERDRGESRRGQVAQRARQRAEFAGTSRSGATIAERRGVAADGPARRIDRPVGSPDRAAGECFHPRSAPPRPPRPRGPRGSLGALGDELLGSERRYPLWRFGYDSTRASATVGRSRPRAARAARPTVASAPSGRRSCRRAATSTSARPRARPAPG